MLTERLTKQEEKLILKLLKQVPPVEAHCCYMNAQRMTLYSEGALLYHEGAFHKPYRYQPGRYPLAHAWNTLNGKIVDVSHPCSAVITKGTTDHYNSKATYRVEDVTAAFARGSWQWIGVPSNYGLLNDPE